MGEKLKLDGTELKFDRKKTCFSVNIAQSKNTFKKALIHKVIKFLYVQARFKFLHPGS